MTCIAVIGLGSIAQRHLRNLRLTFPDAQILALSSSGRVPTGAIENVDEIVLSLQSIISKKPFFVIVASPATFHATHSIPLIEAGIPVLIEKPVTATVTDANDILVAQKVNNGLVAVGYCLRYLPSTIKMKYLLDSGIIGIVHNAWVNIGQFLPDWRTDKNFRKSVSANIELGGGALLELSHELDYLQWLLGNLSLEYAQLRKSSELALEVEEIADMILVSDSGCVCNIHLDFIQKQAQRSCSFVGSTGRLDWDLLKNTITLHTSGKREVLFADESWEKNNMYINLLKDFSAQINGMEYQCISLTEAVNTIALIEEIKEKAVWGKTQ